MKHIQSARQLNQYCCWNICTFSFGGFDYMDFEYSHVRFTIIIIIILIPLEGYKQLNLRSSAKQRQPGRENISLYYYYLHY